MFKYRNFICLFLIFFFYSQLQSTNTQVVWADIPQIRMSNSYIYQGQTSIYDSVYIPLNTTSQLNITYKTALTQIPMDPAIVVSGFQNYLSYEMIFNISIAAVLQNYMTINIKIGPATYLKQLNVNYFVIEASASVDPYFQVSIANYRTLDLDSGTGYRQQNFANQTTSFPNPAVIVSAIHGIQYYNNDGLISQIHTKTWKNNTSNIIHQLASVDEKGFINYLSITTIIVHNAFFPTPLTYTRYGTLIKPMITNTTGFSQLDAISTSDLFEQTDNSLFFGMNSFKFSMQGTRLFLLQITNLTNFRSNLKTNDYMKLTEISIFLLADRTCSNPADKFYIQGYTCQATCTGLLQDTTNLVCKNCLSICNGCTTTIDQCNSCKLGNNRNSIGVMPNNCVCNFGYVDVKLDVCQKCSDLMQGCLACSNSTVCTNCGNTTLFQFYNPAPGSTFCRCKSNKFMVTGICLSYPGCLLSNVHVTGQFCQTCDEPHNFEKDLVHNSSCVCKTAYHVNSANYFCEDVCGDSQTPDKTGACDDGNAQSGDGCSSSCTQEYGYICTVQVIGGVSKCAQKQQIKISYLYSQKTITSNQGILVFSLLPSQQFLAAQTFQNSVSTSIPGSKKVRFDPTTSLIYITVDYPSALESKTYDVNFTFTGLDIYSPDISLKVTTNGFNAKLTVAENVQQINIIVYVTLGVSAFALALALTSSFLGEKLMGIQMILPIQAAFFTMATYPFHVQSPISALWSMKFSNGYNSINSYDLSTNYMLDSRLGTMKYSGQFILNYNLMYLLIALVILIMGIIQLRILWLQRQQKRLQGLQKKKQSQDKQQPKKKKKEKAKGSEGQGKDKENGEDETQQETLKDEDLNEQNLQEQLEDVRQNMKNWRNFLYMIVDRFFSILIITAMLKVIFCFYVQLSNLTYTAEVYDNSINAGFFFLSYATIITGLYVIVYDYKTDKLILFTCNKGKYAIIYIFIFLAFIIVLGATFQTSFAFYLAAAFCLLPICLIPYQVPYGMSVFDFQNIIAMICQLPFIGSVAVSFMLNLNGNAVDQSTCMILAYGIVGLQGLSIILTIIRLIKIIDCKKISCVEFTDRKKQNSNDKNRKKNKVILLQLDMEKDYDEFSEDSVRAVLFERKQKQKQDDFEMIAKSKEGYSQLQKKSDLKKGEKEKEKKMDEEDDDEQIDELEKIKLKLRKQLKQKKTQGKIK